MNRLGFPPAAPIGFSELDDQQGGPSESSAMNGGNGSTQTDLAGLQNIVDDWIMEATEL